MSKVHVKTGDTVILLTGKDEYLYNDKDNKSKGRKTGKVVAVSPKEGKVIVEGFNVVTKHVKPTAWVRSAALWKPKVHCTHLRYSWFARSAVSRPELVTP